MGQHQRSEDRASTSIEGTVTFNDADIPCMLRDISRKGAKVAAEKPLEKGAEIVLSIGAFGVVHGQIVWTSKTVAGIKFSDDPDDVDTILIKLATYAMLQ